MMKQFFLGLSLLAIAGLWTGCSNDEITDTLNDKQSIEFRVQGGMPTLRSTATTLPYVDAFVVYGTDNAATENIFDGVTVAYQAGSNPAKYDYNPKRYYTEGAATANFVAYSPATAKITSPTAPVGLATASFQYTVPEPDDTGNTTQEDLLITGTQVAPSTTAVSLKFQHALSRIFVKATNGLNETVTIKGLTLKSLYPSGTIAGTPATPWTWAWTPSGTKQDYEYILANTGVAVPKGVSAPTLVTSMEQGMMVIPQAGTVLEVTYDVANLENQKAEVDVSGTTFVMGNQYAIKIDFDATATSLIEINFEIDVLPFEAPIDIPVVAP